MAEAPLWARDAPFSPGRWAVAALGAASTIILAGFGLFSRLATPPNALACAALLAFLTIILVGALSTRRVARPTSAAEEPRTERDPPFSAMVEYLADPVLLVAGSDPGDLGDRRFLWANAAARELLRVSRQAGPLTTALRSPEVLAAVEDGLFSEAPAHARWHSRGAQERFWRVEVRALPRDGRTSGEASLRLALLMFHDETEVRRSESTRADFLANASHELRTPLASLAGFIETLRGHARDDSEARDKFLTIMHAQAERMRRLIDDLMSLSRIELSEHIRPAGVVDIASAVTDVLDALGPQAAERHIAIRSTQPPPGKAVAVGDRDQIVQVAMNLIENAIKYTPAGGEVRVDVLAGLKPAAVAAPVSKAAARLSLLTPDPVAGQLYVGLRVQDFGAGIARNHLPRLTERFYRVEGQKARDRPGTGLGLAIVKHIINRHRGGLLVESAVATGSCFTMYVPMAGQAKTASAAVDPVFASGK